MFDRTKAQYKVSDFQKHFGFQIVIAWRQRLCDLVNGERFNGFRRNGASIYKKSNHSEARDCQNAEPNFPTRIFSPTITDKLDNNAVIFESLPRLWMIFVVLNLLPADASGHNEVALKVLVRYTTMFFQKIIDCLGKILVGFSDCWIESKQPHPQSLTNPSEMSLYQLKRHSSDRKVNSERPKLFRYDHNQVETNRSLLFRTQLESSI